MDCTMRVTAVLSLSIVLLSLNAHSQSIPSLYGFWVGSNPSDEGILKMEVFFGQGNAFEYRTRRTYRADDSFINSQGIGKYEVKNDSLFHYLDTA
jgi:hypothetical protein